MTSIARPARRAAGIARRAPRRARWAIEDLRLGREQAAGVLGPAHRAWRPVADHRRYWADYDWSQRGEEWTASPEWKQTLIDDVLERWIPAGGAVLEIGPGAGRWSEVLLERSAEVVLVDVSEGPLELCRERFTGATNVEYVLSSGSDLPGVRESSIDAVWSFDVFVHLHPLDLAAYLGEISRVLRPGGVAVIHHADGRNRGELPSRLGWRSPMSRRLLAALAEERGLRVTAQFDSWGSNGAYDLGAFGDAVSVCTLPAVAAGGD